MKLISANTEKKQIMSVGTTGEDTPKARSCTLFF
ncbi:hypothetical protein DZC18_003091 [Clostridium beijerinckii]|nr:hypothetical protein [Clostridium beijerinckii]